MTASTLPYTVVCSSKDRERWLRERLTGIGASETPTILGLSTFQSMMGIWAEKTGAVEPDSAEVTEPMCWGTRLEPLIAEEYSRKTSRVILPWGLLLRSREHPFILATPDYVWFPNDEPRDIPIELKATSSFKADEWKNGAPERVYYQAQQQMLVTGAPAASIGVLIGGNRFEWCDIDRDEAAIRAIIEACGIFWGWVVNKRLPPIDGSDATRKALSRVFPTTAHGERVTLPEAAVQWAAALELAKADKKDAEAREQEAYNSLVAAIGPAEIGVLPDGSGSFTYRNRARNAYTVGAAQWRELGRAS